MMKQSSIVIALAFMLCLIVGCQQGERVLVQPLLEPEADVEAAIQAIRDITEKWQVAINVGDIDTLMSFYSDNAIKIPPNEPAVVGKEAIRSSYQKHFEEQIRQENHVVTDIRVSGNLAITNTTWTLANAVGELSKAKGNWIRIFWKQPDRAWKIIYMMWSDETLLPPVQAE